MSEPTPGPSEAGGEKEVLEIFAPWNGAKISKNLFLPSRFGEGPGVGPLIPNGRYLYSSYKNQIGR
jgi:hypothetical protein